MSTVVLVGAGATLAEALPQRPKASFRPPLDATFFDLCERAGLPGRAKVRAYMGRRFGIDPFQAQTMESVFSYLYSDVFSDAPPDDSLEAYWALVRMYASAIARTTNRLTGTSHSGVGALLRSIWPFDDEISFVTFNQDLVIEKAIETAAATDMYGDLPWNFLSCYGADFEEFLYPTNGKVFRTRGERNSPEESVSVLKLHGSLNWVWRAETLEDSQNSISDPGSRIYCLTGQSVEGDLELDTPRERFLIPVLVPPIYEKGAHFREFLLPLWNSAREALQAADRLVVFGYSFPETDFSARTLLRTACHVNKNLREVIVVDVNPGVAAALTRLLDLEECHYFSSVPACRSWLARDN